MESTIAEREKAGELAKLQETIEGYQFDATVPKELIEEASQERNRLMAKKWIKISMKPFRPHRTQESEPTSRMMMFKGRNLAADHPAYFFHSSQLCNNYKNNKLF
ncbi:hypothetical protein B9Z55_028186 [Caenorhabditis nigoni]|uniref:Uncharacterized protein n=1 Tax=Caenorhabditis nigoni TaxID=1611254 RepID=A0A2G5SD80_9PELO|nr:hypothetical protein B9Z55_028186 [Caenorhabditis nigoni]